MVGKAKRNCLFTIGKTSFQKDQICDCEQWKLGGVLRCCDKAEQEKTSFGGGLTAASMLDIIHIMLVTRQFVCLGKKNEKKNQFYPKWGIYRNLLVINILHLDENTKS
jgi:hypothetical protein